jgi:DNA ligase-1
MGVFRPLLSPIDDPQKNPEFFNIVAKKFPLLGSSKFDGIRSIIAEDGAMSRTWKPIPSRQVQEDFTSIIGLDGELIAGNPHNFDVYNRSQSHIMSKDKPHDIGYYVFDCVLPGIIDKPYYERLEHAHGLIRNREDYFPVLHVELNNMEELLEFENGELEKGFEGIMLRDPVGRYKQGRATMNEGIIYKVKRFQDTEGRVVGFVQRMANNNVQERDELGFAKRSSAKAGKTPVNMVGKFLVEWNGLTLEVAPGSFKHTELEDIWMNQELFLGKLLKFRFFLHGSKDLPRFPRALGWRSKMDM